jgi:hypothetical protein
VCRRFRIRSRNATIGFFEEDRIIFMPYRSLLVFTFRVTCVLDKCTLEYKLYSCVYIRTCSRLVAEQGSECYGFTVQLGNKNLCISESCSILVLTTVMGSSRHTEAKS